ncbi:MAG: transglycosylase SLT domain-containing protein [Nitrospinaceae bacterium]
MTFPFRLLAFFILFFFLQGSTVFATRLDIFNTGEPFPTDLFPRQRIIVDLGHLDKEEIPSILLDYKKAERKIRSREKKNLLVLAIGYLYFQKSDFQNAVRYLETKIIGNFILEDFRLHHLALALNEIALVEIEKKQYRPAIELLRRSIKLRLTLFKSYPDSPFHENVQRDLSEAEKLLGDAYFLSFNYKAAWQVYRRSLMREFPGNEEHRLGVNLSLAKTYESAGEWIYAADIYASLLKISDSPEVLEAVGTFLKKYEKKLLKAKVDISSLRPPADPSTETNPMEKKETAQKPSPAAVTYENEMVRDFYGSLKRQDLEGSLELGLSVLTHYPGIQEARGITGKVNRLIAAYLHEHPINQTIEKITGIYPDETLNELGYLLWTENLLDPAAVVYQKILKKFPLETRTCHKATFFLGRILEDKGQYSRAIDYYSHLIEKYDFGPYTTAALFKIPWVLRLQGKYKEARTHFQRLLEFYSSRAYRRLSKIFPNGSSYKTAALYWLAQTEEGLGNSRKKLSLTQELSEKYPFDFYTIFSQGELGAGLRDFLIRKTSQKITFRYFGLGDIQRKRLSRAEKLIAVGFLEYGANELAPLVTKEDDPAFSFYLAQLFNRGGNFQDSIRLSWTLANHGNREGISRVLAERLFPKAFLKEVLSVTENYDLDPWFILSLMRQESAFNPKITSSANAIGLMQLLPRTAAGVARSLEQEVPTPEQLKAPEVNIQLGIDYLNELLKSFGGNRVHALAAYNAGPNKVRQWISYRSNLYPLEFIESIPYTETRHYVKKVLRNYAIYLALYGDPEGKRIKELLTISRK